VADLKRLPKFLLDALEAETAEGEVVERVFGMMRRIPLRLRWTRPAIERLVVKQHRMIMNRIHRRHHPEKHPIGPQGLPHGPERAVNGADVGHDQRIHGDGDVERSLEVVELVHRPVPELDPGDVSTTGEALPCPFEHSGREVDRNHAGKPRGEVRQEWAGAASKVGDGLRAGLGDRLERGHQRALDARVKGVEEELVVERCFAAPLAVLVAKVNHRGFAVHHVDVEGERKNHVHIKDRARL